jgi:hypothetical protein
LFIIERTDSLPAQNADAVYEFLSRAESPISFAKIVISKNTSLTDLEHKMANINTDASNAKTSTPATIFVYYKGPAFTNANGDLKAKISENYSINLDEFVRGLR